jgi:hypothetical protein
MVIWKLYGLLFTVYWYILLPFGKFYGRLVYFLHGLVCLTKKNLAILRCGAKLFFIRARVLFTFFMTQQKKKEMSPLKSPAQLTTRNRIRDHLVNLTVSILSHKTQSCCTNRIKRICPKNVFY